eukprot:GHRQ01031016.1.p1 GENE.GHRQ01031016.1~~GHRQ01031016.1.p1  ORF type:complete len:166 (+),score=20.51 GHRQ01031016.1:96-593(+)
MGLVCMMCAAVAHASNAVLQSQPSCQHCTACANECALRQLLRPGQPYAAHLLLRDAAIEEALYILRVVGKTQRCCICGQAGRIQREKAYKPSAAQAVSGGTTAAAHVGVQHCSGPTTILMPGTGRVLLGFPGHVVVLPCRLRGSESARSLPTAINGAQAAAPVDS